MATSKNSLGKITQIIGPVVDVAFESADLPEIGMALLISNATIDDRKDNLTVEVEVPFSPETFQVEEARSALERCVAVADAVERELLGTDQPLSVFAADLNREITRG